MTGYNGCHEAIAKTSGNAQCFLRITISYSHCFLSKWLTTPTSSCSLKVTFVLIALPCKAPILSPKQWDNFKEQGKIVSELLFYN